MSNPDTIYAGSWKLEYVKEEIDANTGDTILFYRYTVPIDYTKIYITLDLSAPPAEEKKCACGVDAAGGGIHSDWCPKYKENQ